MKKQMMQFANEGCTNWYLEKNSIKKRQTHPPVLFENNENSAVIPSQKVKKKTPVETTKPNLKSALYIK